MKKSNEAKEIKETANLCELVGTVGKIIYQNEKVCRFTICTYAKSKNDKQIYRYVPVIAFEDLGLEEGDELKVFGYISTDKNEYNGKTTYDTIVHALEVVEV